MDIEYLLFLQNLRAGFHGIFDSLFLYITTLGEDFVLMVWISGFYWCVCKRLGIYLMFNFHIANFANQMIKITACVYRPWVRDSRIMPVEAAKGAATGYSFPSGHTAKAVAVWGGLAAGLKKCRPLKLLFTVLVLAIGFSRNYLGVHTPQDVIVSIILGYIFLILCRKILLWIENGENRDLRLFLGGILLALCLLVYGALKSYPMDYVEGQLLVEPEGMVSGSIRGAGGVMGLLIAWIWERRWIGFDEAHGVWMEKLFRFLIGIGGLLVIVKVVPSLINLFLPGKWCAFLNGFLSPVYIVALYPLCIKKMTWKEAVKE